MFRTIWSKSLRDYRVPILSWGIGLGLLMVAGFISATSGVVAGLASLAKLFRFLGDGFAMQTPEGYITFRYMGVVVPLILSIWFILAGARLVRGEEVSGILDVLLSTSQSRTRLLLEKIGALVIAALLIAVLFALGASAGGASIGHLNVVRALLTGLNVSLLAFTFGMVALLISQYTLSSGAAAGGASGLLLLALALDITGREVNGSWVQYFSPFYYYNLNRPLIPSFQDTPVAALLLVGLSVLCAALSLVLFARRDIGRAAFAWQGKKVGDSQQQMLHSLSRAEHAVSTQSVGLQTLNTQGWFAFWWLFGIAAFSAYCTLLVPSIQQAFYRIVQQTPWIAQVFFDTPTNTNAGLLGAILFSFLPALIVIVALVLALKWSADLENGRLELTFSTPKSRERILLERFGANFFVVLLAPTLTWLVLIIGARLVNIDVDQGRIAAASFGMLPPAFITLSLIYALAGRVRYGIVVGVLSTYLFLSFMEETLEGMIQIPSWVMSLSIFHLYGNPVFLGMNWNNFLGMMVVAVVLLIVGLIQFRTVDIYK